MANSFFRRQLGLYASVHRDARNKATHFIGIPMIVFSLLLALTQWQLEVAGHRTSGAAVLAVLAVLGWMTLDVGIGIAMGVVMLAGALGTPSAVWIGFAALFVFGWALQFLGHHYEGKRPALVDNLFQGFIGPMFLVAEVMVVNGYRRDLANSVAQGDVTTL
jgi:uncharacterized membrane protein YGL010W